MNPQLALTRCQTYSTINWNYFFIANTEVFSLIIWCNLRDNTLITGNLSLTKKWVT